MRPAGLLDFVEGPREGIDLVIVHAAREAGQFSMNAAFQVALTMPTRPMLHWDAQASARVAAAHGLTDACGGVGTAVAGFPAAGGLVNEIVAEHVGMFAGQSLDSASSPRWSRSWVLRRRTKPAAGG
jgi:hypothetical protein